MSATGEPASSRSPRRPVTFVRELLSVLVGVEHAEVKEDGAGAIGAIRVWGTGEFSPRQLVRNIQTALRAHLDLSVDAECIHVMSGPPPARTQVPKDALDAAIANVLRSGSRDEGAVAGGRDGQGSLHQPSREFTAAPTRPEAEPSLEPVNDRILYEGYEVVSHRSRESLLRVTLEWRERQFIGQAHGTDDPRDAAEALARATLKALEGIVHTRIRNAGFSLELTGLQFTEIFGYRLVVSVVKLNMNGEALPLSGSVVVRHGAGLAAILSVLQAADRRVRAILEDGTEPAPQTPPPPGAH